MNEELKKLCLIGIKSRNRNSTIQEIRNLFTRAVLGEKFTPDFQPKGIKENMWIQDSISLAGELHQLFESINIDYLLVEVLLVLFMENHVLLVI